MKGKVINKAKGGARGRIKGNVPPTMNFSHYMFTNTTLRKSFDWARAIHTLHLHTHFISKMFNLINNLVILKTTK